MSASLKRKKIIIWSTAIVALVGLLLLLISLLSPKYIIDYIEENDLSYVNRQITIKDVSFNPLNFTIKILGFKMQEPGDDSSTFVSCDVLTVNLDALPLLSSKIHVKSATANNLFGHIIQNGNRFNFSDLLESEHSETKEESDPIEFNLQNLNVLKSSIHYSDKQLGSKIIIDSITITEDSFTSSDTVLDAKVAFHQQAGGWFKADASYNLKSQDYRIDTKVLEWELSPFKPYVTSAIQLSEFDGHIDAEFKLKGNTSSDFIKTSGQISVVDFKMVDPESKPLVNIGKLFVDVKEVDSQQNIYNFKDIVMENSNIVFEYLPNGDNFTKCLIVSDANTSTEAKDHKETDYYVSPFEMLSVYIYDMTKEYIFKSYTAEKILFSNFNLKFYDYTMEDPFFMDLTEVEIKADNIKPENQFAEFNVHGKMNKTGIIDGAVSVSRQGVENMNVDMNVKGLFLNRFSPYGRYYTAHQFLEGVSSFSNKSEIKDSYLISSNELFVENIKVSKKNKTSSGYSLPMRLVVGLMKDKEGNIDLEIPIEGPINDPKYKFGKVIWQVVKNLFTKIAASPFKALSNTFSVNEDDLKNIYFENGQVMLSPKQKKSLNSMVTILNKKEAVVIQLNHLYNKEYEMDAIALKNVKLAYLKQSDLPIDPEIPIGKQAFDIPSNDDAFLEYLKQVSPNYDATISIPENVRKLLGQHVVEQKLINVVAKQKQVIKDYLITEKNIPENRFNIKDAATTDEAINQTRPKFEVKFGVEE